MKRWAVALLLFCAACTPNPAMVETPLPPLCNDATLCHDATCSYIGVSGEWENPTAAMSDARLDVVKQLTAYLRRLPVFSAGYFPQESSPMSRTLEKAIAVCLAAQVHYTQKVIFEDEASTGKTQRACVKGEIAPETIDRCVRESREKLARLHGDAL